MGQRRNDSIFCQRPHSTRCNLLGTASEASPFLCVMPSRLLSPFLSALSFLERIYNRVELRVEGINKEALQHFQMPAWHRIGSLKEGEFFCVCFAETCDLGCIYIYIITCFVFFPLNLFLKTCSSKNIRFVGWE